MMNTKLILWIFLFLFLSLSSVAKNKIEISLITCSKGDMAYSAFGHTALRVIDHEMQRDLIFNFGIFNFNTPNFQYKFIKGNLDYKLGIKPFSNFVYLYDIENRAMWEQKLNFSDSVKQIILDTLLYLHRPENRYYTYHFLSKNCTSEVRDVLSEHISGFDELHNQEMSVTFRQMLNAYLDDKPWMRLGINLIMGRSVDKKVNGYQYMALPNALMEKVNSATVNGKPVVAERNIILPPTNQRKSLVWNHLPFFVFILLLFGWIFYPHTIFMYSIWVITGITGVVIASLMMISQHIELLDNLNILSISPLFLLLVVFKMVKHVKLAKYTADFILALIAIRLFMWLLGVQPIQYALLPFYVLLVFTLIKVIHESCSTERKIKLKQMQQRVAGSRYK